MSHDTATEGRAVHPQTSAFGSVLRCAAPHITKCQQLVPCSCTSNAVASFTTTAYPRCAHRPSCTHRCCEDSINEERAVLRKWCHFSKSSIMKQWVPIAPWAIPPGKLCRGTRSFRKRRCLNSIIRATRQHRTYCAGYVCRHSCARSAWSQVCLPSVHAASAVTAA